MIQRVNLSEEHVNNPVIKTAPSTSHRYCTLIITWINFNIYITAARILSRKQPFFYYFDITKTITDNLLPQNKRALRMYCNSFLCGFEITHSSAKGKSFLEV